LTASIDGPVEFETGTINPSRRNDEIVEWRLNDVLTNQRLGLVFPEDVAAREAFLDGVGNLAVTLVLLLVAVVALGLRTGNGISPKRLALVTVMCVVGFASSYILHGMLGFFFALMVGSLLAAVSAAAITSWRSLAVLLPVALLPVASMAADAADVWLLALAVIAIVAFVSPLYARHETSPKVA
jgi:hypothetical protein